MKTMKRSLKLYSVGVGVLWTMAMLLSLAWNIRTLQIHVLEIAKNSATAVFNKDIAFRKWVAGHGGIYVPATADTPPNPYLAQVPDRDVIMKNGVMLTLMNPAYALRQVTLEYEKFSGTRGRITSLKPLNPMNSPDEWERKTLISFEHGVKEVSEVSLIDHTPYMRIMKPFVTESSCLKCHAHQGYKLGEIRGGISVSEPLEPFLASTRKNIVVIAFSHVLFWLLGLAAIGVSAIHINGRIRERVNAQEELEGKVVERTAALQKALDDVKTLKGFIPICSHCKKIRNDQGYWEQLEKYLYEHSDVQLSHGICPDCIEKYYPEYTDKDEPTTP